MVRYNKFLSGAALVFCATLSLPAVSQTQVLMRDQSLLQELKVKASEVRSRGESPSYYSGFLGVDSDDVIGTLESKGLSVLNKIGGLYIVNMPVDEIEAIASTAGVNYIELARELKKNMNSAIQSGNVDMVHSGEGLEGYSFNGDGVIVGVFDIGIDPNHPNFNGDVEAVFAYSGGSGNLEPTVYTGADVKNFTTDTSGETHGTHVLGIAGGRSGQTIDEYYTYAVNGNTATISKHVNEDNPFIGTAPGSRLVVACGGNLYNTWAADAVARIAKYAQEEGVPAVVNLSIGNNIGPHDGTDGLAYSLSNIAKENSNLSIVVASGNEGDENSAITKTFTADDTSLRTFVMPFNLSSLTQVARFSSSTFGVEIYSNDDTPFTGKFSIYNSQGTLYRSWEITEMAGDQKSLITSTTNGYLSQGTVTIGRGKVKAGYGTSKYDGIRYSGQIDFKSLTTSTTGGYLCIEITGQPGQRVDMFINNNVASGVSVGGCFSGNNLSGFDAPDGQMSLSSVACGDGTIVIGSHNSDPYWVQLTNPSTNQNPVGWAEADGSAPVTGDITYFTSFGKTITGKSAPHFTAPGRAIKSSYNSYYNPALWGETQMLVAQKKVGSTTYYWGAMMGTSMATPFATGVMALWQQASLEKNGRALSTQELINIGQKTATVDDLVKAGHPIQWGAGKLNAYDGVKEILGTYSSIGKVDIDNKDNDFMFSLYGRDLNLFVAGATGLKVDIVNIAGQNILSRNHNGNDLNLSLANLASGIYIVSVNTPEGGSYSKKISLR